MVTAFPRSGSARFVLCRVIGSEEVLFIDRQALPRPGDLVAVERPDGLYTALYRAQPVVGVILPALRFANFANHPQ